MIIVLIKHAGNRDQTHIRYMRGKTDKNMVEVAGIEPASKERRHKESTCLVVFDLGHYGKDNQTRKAPAESLDTRVSAIRV